MLVNFIVENFQPPSRNKKLKTTVLKLDHDYGRVELLEVQLMNCAFCKREAMRHECYESGWEPYYFDIYSWNYGKNPVCPECAERFLVFNEAEGEPETNQPEYVI